MFHHLSSELFDGGYLDDGNATGQACNTLVELLLLVVHLRLGHDVLDLLHAGLDCVLGAAITHNGGALLADLNLGGHTQDLLTNLAKGVSEG